MADEEGSDKPKKDLGKIMTLAFMALNLTILAGGAFLVFSSTLGHKSAVSTEEDLNKELVEFRKSLHQKPVLYTMNTFNTNLDGIPRRLIRMRKALRK